MMQSSAASRSDADPSSGERHACEVIGAIWQEEMGIDGVTPADDYFALGGDSLTAVRIMIRIRGAFGVELPISVLLERPTLLAFARHVRDCGEACENRPQGPLSPSDIEEGLV